MIRTLILIAVAVICGGLGYMLNRAAIQTPTLQLQLWAMACGFGFFGSAGTLLQIATERIARRG